MPLAGYTDWLQEVDEVGGPLRWATQQRVFPPNTLNNPEPVARSPSQIKEDVLSSPRVQDTVRDVSREMSKSKEEVLRECREIIETMGHSFNLISTRAVGFVVCKVVRTIFDEVLVNLEELKKIREMWKETPVVFIPTHRTYMDFLLLSMLCFHEEVPLPAIAAAMDFMSSRLIGEALRACGAFFIRRSVGKDKLYWAIFTEYVQTHIVNADRPVEFFIEGTRSRVGKSIAPKYGLLQLLIEPYLRGNVYDMLIVPIAINYDKILEEQLYAYELLGFPKPKESTSGLFKARSVLSKRFGRAIMTFCPPFSLREYFGHSIKRSTFVCQPDSQFQISDREKEAIRHFGYEIVRVHNEATRFDIWPVAALALLKLLDDTVEKRVGYQQLLAEVYSILKLLARLKITVTIYKTIEEDLKWSLALHSDLFTPIDITQSDVHLELLPFPVHRSKRTVPLPILQNAIVPIILTNHSNQAIHTLAAFSLLAIVVVRIGPGLHIDEYAKSYNLIRSLMYREFIYDPTVNEYEKIFSELVKSGILSLSSERVEVAELALLQQLTSYCKPNVELYLLVLEVLLSMFPLQVTMEEVCDSVHQAVSYHLSKHAKSVRITFLSTESIKNAFNTLAESEVLKKQGTNHLIQKEKIEGVINSMRECVILSQERTKREESKL